MKVIFLEDLPRVARAGEVKDVADGYARNYLIPKKLATVVKPGIVNTIAARQAKIEAGLKETAGKIDGVAIELKAKAGTKDRLYGAVTAADIARELSAATGLDIDKKRIELDKPIHQLGSYDIGVRLGGEIMPVIKVNVSGEAGAPAEAGTADKEKAESEADAAADESAEPEASTVAEESTEPEAGTAADESIEPEISAIVEDSTEEETKPEE